MLLNQLCEGFLLDCSARNLSTATPERNYKPILIRLTKYLDNPEIGDTTPSDLKRFAVHLQSTNIKPWSLYAYIRVVRRLFSWTAQEGILESNLTSNLKYPKIPKKPIPICYFPRAGDDGP
jgi:site-specific recombinase XerD